MALRLSDQNRRSLQIFLGFDVAALLVATYHQFNTPYGTRWAWGIFLAMVVLTAVFALVARSDNAEDVIKGLPIRRGDGLRDGLRDDRDGPQGGLDGPQDGLDGPQDGLDGPQDGLDGPQDGQGR